MTSSAPTDDRPRLMTADDNPVVRSMLGMSLEHTGRDQDLAVEEEQLDLLHAIASEAREALSRQLLDTGGRS